MGATKCGRIKKKLRSEANNQQDESSMVGT